MRHRILRSAAPLFFCASCALAGPLGLACSGTDAGVAPPDGVTPGDDASVPGPGPEGGASPVRDGGVSTSDATVPVSSDAASGTDASDAPPGDATGVDLTVTPFSKRPIYFAGADNQRTVDAPAAFPVTGTYAKVMLHLELSCPTSGGCDAWDRFGTLGLIQGDADAASPAVLEVARFMTPYGVGGAWDYDITDLRPLLTGNITFRAFIDTWVGPGSSSGGGWLLTTKIVMTGGKPAREPIAVLPVWTMRNAVYGDPSKPVSGSFGPQDLALPAGATKFAIRTFVTGHGQGNADNCGEFCTRVHTITAAAKPHTLSLWRDDCATTAVPNQNGTWQYSRAGWCPGADVKPWTVDVTADLAGAAKATFAWGLDGYDNTCRPGVTTCTGCTLGTGCDYDNGNHTEPYFSASTVLIAYR